MTQKHEPMRLQNLTTFQFLISNVQKGPHNAMVMTQNLVDRPIMYVFILHFETETPWYGIATPIDGGSTNFKAFVSEVPMYSW